MKSCQNERTCRPLQFLMAFIFILLFLTTMPTMASATTNVGLSVITTNTTWTLSGSPYYLSGPVTIDQGATLTIEPGVVVKLGNSTSFSVNGVLDAEGNQANPIYFTSYLDDTVAGDTNGDGSATSPSIASWNAISINSGGSATLKYCTAKYYYYGLQKTGPGSLIMESCSLTNGRYGINLDSATGSVAIRNCVVKDNLERGITINESNPILQDNVFTSNRFGLYISADDSFSGTGNNFSGNHISATATGGTVARNTTWGRSLSPYFILGSNLTVSPGATLTIEPGVVIKYCYDYNNTLTEIQGTLNVLGTETEPVCFTDCRDDIVGGDNNADGAETTPQASSWKGLIVTGSGSAALQNCLIKYADIGLYKTGSGNLTAKNCTVTKSGVYGVLFCYSSGTDTLSNCSITNNSGSGIYIEGSCPELQNNIISGNNYSVYIGINDSFTGSGNTMTGNKVNKVVIGFGVITKDTTWTKTRSPYYIDGYIGLAAGVTLTIEPGVIVKFVHGGDFETEGNLKAHGTDTDPIYFTSYSDDTVGGDSNEDGNASLPSAGSGGNLRFVSTGSANMTNCIIKYGTYDLFKSGSGNLNISNCRFCNSSQYGVLINNSTGRDTIANSFINDNENYGILIEGSSPFLFKNKIYSNSIGVCCWYNANPIIGGSYANANEIYQNTQKGVQNDSAGITVNAQYNWWGDNSGPYHPVTNPTGKGNPVSDNVDYSNYIGPVRPVIFSSITTDKPSPQPVNTTVRITAKASGGTQLLYKFLLYKGLTPKVLREYSTANYCDWSPTTTGNYIIAVYVKDQNSKDRDAYKTIRFEVQKAGVQPVDINEITTNVPSPQVTNTIVRITANASGGSELIYKFVVDGPTQGYIRNYTSDNFCDWWPSDAAEYVITVYVKDKNSTKEYDASKTMNYVIIPDPVIHPAVINDFIAEKPSPQPVNTMIRLIAYASGGTNLQYKFLLSDGSTQQVLRDYSPTNNYDWTPSAAGKYVLSVYVKEQNSTNEPDASKEMAYEIVQNTVVKPIAITSLTTDKPDPQAVHSTIRVTAEASGGTNLVYRFVFFNKSNFVTKVTEYSPCNYYDWTPSSAGNYAISVYVKEQNSSGSGVLKAITYTVSK